MTFPVGSIVGWRPRWASNDMPAIVVRTPWWLRVLGRMRILMHGGEVRVGVRKRELQDLSGLWERPIVRRMFIARGYSDFLNGLELVEAARFEELLQRERGGGE